MLGKKKKDKRTRTGLKYKTMAQIQLPGKRLCSYIKLSEILQSLLPHCTWVCLWPSQALQEEQRNWDRWGVQSGQCPDFRRTAWQALCLMRKENERYMVRREGCHSSPHGVLQGLKLVCFPSVSDRNPSGHQEAIPVLLELIYCSLSPI